MATNENDGPLKLHHLRPAPGSNKSKLRVGRGEASKGKTAGRGTKGTGARKNVPASFEGGQMPLQMRLPKLKGFRNRNKVVAQVVNVSDLSRLFPDGGAVGPAELLEQGYIAGHRTEPAAVGKSLVIDLKYGPNRERSIAGIKRISKPGLRIYAKSTELPRVLGGLGVAIISTSSGLLTDRQAYQRRMGGEVLAFVW